MELFVEICTFVKLRNANLKPVAELGKCFGFRSVYMFDEEDAATIRYNGHSRGFKYFDLYSDCLFVDIDIKTPEEAQKAVEDVKRLKALGIRFDIYDSGNRSVHLHIPHELMHSRHMPYTHMKVVEKLGITCDLSIYRGNSLYRLPRTIHTKTGNPKVLKESVDGKLLKFPIIPEPPKENSGITFAKNIDAECVFNMMRNACLDEPEQHYMRLFAISCTLYDMGLDEGLVYGLLSMLNNYWDEPTSEENVAKAVAGGKERVLN